MQGGGLPPVPEMRHSVRKSSPNIPSEHPPGALIHQTSGAASQRCGSAAPLLSPSVCMHHFLQRSKEDNKAGALGILRAAKCLGKAREEADCFRKPWLKSVNTACMQHGSSTHLPSVCA